MIRGHCDTCNKITIARKKRFSIFWFIIFGGIFYGLYRLVFVRRNKCSECLGGLK